MEEYVTNNNDVLFTFVMSMVWSAGGDGNGVIVLPTIERVQEMVFEFSEWMKNDPFLSRSVYEKYELSPGHVLFTDGSNENLVFVCADQAHEARTPWRLEIWLEIV